MLAFLLDQHVRIEIAQGLRRRGIDVITALEDGSARFDDAALLERATIQNRILVTQDQDFLRITSHWQATGRPFAGVIFAIRQDVDIGGTIEYLELAASVLTFDDMRNRVEFIPAGSHG
jgi:predicted nuclease of predicted toxin-antitoxin system